MSVSEVGGTCDGEKKNFNIIIAILRVVRNDAAFFPPQDWQSGKLKFLQELVKYGEKLRSH